MGRIGVETEWPKGNQWSFPPLSNFSAVSGKLLHHFVCNEYLIVALRVGSGAHVRGGGRGTERSLMTRRGP